MILYLAEVGHESSAGDTVDYEEQQVLPGAILNEFDASQIYRRKVIGNNDDDGTTKWEAVGETVSAFGSINCSDDGARVAYIDVVTKGPKVVERECWRLSAFSYRICFGSHARG